MRYSQMFGKTSKTTSAEADSVNARLLIQAGYIRQQMAGVYNYLPLGLRVLTNIQQIIREEMNLLGGSEILMPVLSQEESWKTTNRNAMEVLFHLIGQGNAELVLNPTHEEVVTPLVQQFVFSYRDLPVAVYQIQNKFRNEARAKSGLLRGREFNMKDMYSFHRDEAELLRFYEEVKQAYVRVYQRLGLGDLTLLTYASGGAFSKYSHEYQTICEQGEDTLYVCESCNIAINKEIIEGQDACPECGGKVLVEKKGIEVGNIFQLRTRFSEAFHFQYQDEQGQLCPVEMGCYGMGPSRIMGTLAEVFHDDHGLIWPESVAPFQVHLTSLGNEFAVVQTADVTYQKLLAAGVDVLYDDRDISAGEKLTDADLIGNPWRVVISQKTLSAHALEVKRRDTREIKLVSASDFLKAIARPF